MLEVMAAQLGVDVEDGDRRSDPTAEALADRLSAAMLAKQVAFCLHVGASPIPLHVRAWDRPYVLRCLHCAAFAPAVDSVEDNTCDSCGRYDPSGIWPSQMTKGPLTLFMGRCDDCIPVHVKERGKK